MRYGLLKRAPSRRAFTLVELLTVLGVIALLAALLLPVFARMRETARATTCLSNLKQIGLAINLYLQDNDETFPMSRFPDAAHSLGGCTSPGTNYPEGGLRDTSVNWKRVVAPYAKNRGILECPSNGYVWNPNEDDSVPGDETNRFYPKSDWLPNSYAYNGSFFHEAVPACWYGEPWERPRYLVEIEAPSNLILLLESRFGYPDLGGWFMSQRGPRGGSEGPFQSHHGMCNWLFADQHAKRLKLAATCQHRMWTDRYVDRAGGCENLHQMADEYR